MIEVKSGCEWVDRPRLYGWLSEAYWSKTRTQATIDRSLENSECWVALDDGEMVGFARVVTDLATFAWLCDVYVDPSRRGEGISKAMMNVVLSNDRYQGVRWMLGTRDAHGLYAQYGFESSNEADRWMIRGFNKRPQ